VAPIATRFYNLETTESRSRVAVGVTCTLSKSPAHFCHSFNCLRREVSGDWVEHDTDDDNQGKQQSEAKQRAARPPGMDGDGQARSPAFTF